MRVFGLHHASPNPSTVHGRSGIPIHQCDLVVSARERDRREGADGAATGYEYLHQFLLDPCLASNV
jgi:hypothetical protein